MTANSRLATKDWNELNDKEWNDEFQKSRHLMVTEIIDLFERRPELATAFEIDEIDITAMAHEESVQNMDILWKPDSGVEADSHRPVRFRIGRQRRDRYGHYKPYNGVVIKVMASWTIGRSHDIRDQKYGLRKDGTHNIKAIGNRIEKILDAAIYKRDSDIQHKEWKVDYEQRLNAAYPEFEWDENGVVTVGNDYFAPSLEIEAPNDFDEAGLNIELTLNGLTMDEVKPLIALVEKYVKREKDETK